MADGQQRPNYPDVLRRAVDEMLVETLSLPLRMVIFRLLNVGVAPQDLLSYLREITGGPTHPAMGLIFLQCEAYVERQLLEEGRKEGRDV